MFVCWGTRWLVSKMRYSAVEELAWKNPLASWRVYVSPRLRTRVQVSFDTPRRGHLTAIQNDPIFGKISKEKIARKLFTKVETDVIFEVY